MNFLKPEDCAPGYYWVLDKNSNYNHGRPIVIELMDNGMWFRNGFYEDEGVVGYYIIEKLTVPEINIDALC